MGETQIPVLHKHVVAVDHVGVAVPGFNVATEWYRASLGFINYRDEINEEQGVHEATVGPADKVESDAFAQILAPLNDQSTIAKCLGKKGPGIQQYAVRVTDLEALMAHLKEQGIRVLYPESKIGTVGPRTNFVHPKDAGGVLLELAESAR